MSKVILGLGVACLLTLSGIALWLDRPAPNRGMLTGGPAVEKIDASAGAIYSVGFPDLEGREQSLGQWQNKLLIINFWATWCAPCKEEMPIFAKLQQTYGSRGLQIVGIAVDSSINVANFSQKSPMGYPLLVDEARAIEFSKRLGNRLGLLPFTLVLKPGGDIIFTRLGIVTEREMVDLIVKNLVK